MKKFLFATTALIATTSVAAAEIKFSGYGRAGLAYKEDRGGARSLQRTANTAEQQAVVAETESRNASNTAAAAQAEVDRSRSNAANLRTFANNNSGPIGARFREAAEFEEARTLEFIAAASSAEAAAAEVQAKAAAAREAADEAQEAFERASSISDRVLAARLRLNIEGIWETDMGPRFEALIRLQAEENADTGAADAGSFSGARVSMIYGGLRIDAGNVGGSIDSMPNYYGNEPGLQTFVGQYSAIDYGPQSFSSDEIGANAVFFQYGVEDFAVNAFYDQDASAGTDIFEIGAQYTFDNITAALAYGKKNAETGEDSSLLVFTLGADFGDFSGTLLVADDDVSDTSRNGTAYGLSAAYNIGDATKLTFAYGDGTGHHDERQIGVGFIHDLDGRASLRGGIGKSKIGGEDGVMQADFGAQFNF